MGLLKIVLILTLVNLHACIGSGNDARAALPLDARDQTDKINQSLGPDITAKQTYEVKVEQDIVYGKALSHKTWNSEQTEEIDLLLDVYQPIGIQSKRPVIFLFHGGGFIDGNKQNNDIVNSANFFATRGFIAITPNYRVASHFGTLPKTMYESLNAWPNFLKEDRDAYFAMYPASRDSKASVRWMYANSKKLNANTDYITSLGNSAGALMSIVLGTTDETQFRDEISLAEDISLEKTIWIKVQKFILSLIIGEAPLLSTCNASFSIKTFTTTTMRLCKSLMEPLTLKYLFQKQSD
jgi:acetyl esterase/lipase